MADKKKTDSRTDNKTTGSAGSAVWNGVKRELGEAKEMTSLRLKASSLERKRDGLYTKLGKVAYSQLHPANGTVKSELDAQAEAFVKQITELNTEISSVRLKIKMKKKGLKS